MRSLVPWWLALVGIAVFLWWPGIVGFGLVWAVGAAGRVRLRALFLIPVVLAGLAPLVWLAGNWTTMNAVSPALVMDRPAPGWLVQAALGAAVAAMLVEFLGTDASDRGRSRRNSRRGVGLDG